MTHLGNGDNSYHYDKKVLVFGVAGLILIGLIISIAVYYGVKYQRQHIREKLRIPTELSYQYIASKNIEGVHLACRHSLDLVSENTAWIKYKFDKPQSNGNDYLEVQLKKIGDTWNIVLVDESDNPCNWPFDL